MLQVIQSIKDLDRSQLMGVYQESIEKNARENYPGRSDGLLQAEMDLYAYLRNVVFKTAGAKCCLWVHEGVAVSALRLEPYQDGFLLTALETKPECRGQGFAQKLVTGVLEKTVPGTAVYSHIAKDNLSSIAVHEKCGFHKVYDHARMLDGTVTARVATYRYDERGEK